MVKLWRKMEKRMPQYGQTPIYSGVEVYQSCSPVSCAVV